MKVLVVYASAGAGHYKAAEAVFNYLKTEYNEVEVKLIDILEKTNALFRFNYSWGYSQLIKYLPFLWRWAFWITYNKTLRFLTRPIASLINQLNTTSFAKTLVQENPDYIISTHFLPPEIAAHLKKKKKISSQIVTLITDFGVHPFWISAGTDIYVVALGFTKDILIREGIEEDKIREFGIPIDAKFLKEYEKEALFKKFNIDKDKFTVLTVTGSFGMGPIEEIVDVLHKDVQFLVVCAGNKRLFTRLNEKKYPDVKVFGFVDNMQELMAVSDMIVTKPGGLSISELLAMELAPVFIWPIPGQETANIEALRSYGVGIEVKDIREVKAIVLDYKEHPDKLKSIKERIRKIKKPNAAKEICNAICKSSSGSCG